MKHLRRLFENLDNKEDIEDLFVKLQDFGYFVDVKHRWIDFFSGEAAGYHPQQHRGDRLGPGGTRSHLFMKGSRAAPEMSIEKIWNTYLEKGKGKLNNNIEDLYSFLFYLSSEAGGPYTEKEARERGLFECFVISTMMSNSLRDDLKINTGRGSAPNFNSINPQLLVSSDPLERMILTLGEVEKEAQEWFLQLEKKFGQWKETMQRMSSIWEKIHSKLDPHFYIFLWGDMLQKEKGFSISMNSYWILIPRKW